MDTVGNSDNCHIKVFTLMEQLLEAMARRSGQHIIIDKLRDLAAECGDYVKPFIDAVNGIEPVGLSSAVSYYMYVAYTKGKITINKGLINGLNVDGDPRDLYNEVYDRLINALKGGDYFTASFLADLAFITRSYVLCREVGNVDCGWLLNALKNRLAILLNY